METLTTRGRTARLIVTAVVFSLLLAGTVWGDEDEFPFGPFRMYATNAGPNAPVADTRVEGVAENGSVTFLNESNSGVRRAEIEGQLPQFVQDPARLARVDDAYRKMTPQGPPLVEVRIIVRWHQVHNSRPTNKYTDETVARWRVK